MIRQWIENIEEQCLRVRWRYLRSQGRLPRTIHQYSFWLWNRDRMWEKGCQYTGVPGHLWSDGIPYRGGSITRGTREGGGRRQVDHPQEPVRKGQAWGGYRREIAIPRDPVDEALAALLLKLSSGTRWPRLKDLHEAVAAANAYALAAVDKAVLLCWEDWIVKDLSYDVATPELPGSVAALREKLGGQA